VKSSRRSPSLRCCSLLWIAFASTAVCAQDATGLREMTRPDDALELPGIGRVVLVFVLMVVVALGVAAGLRHFRSRLGSQLPGRSITVVERTLVGGARLYLLQVDTHRVLLSEHRGRTSMLVLPAANEANR